METKKKQTAQRKKREERESASVVFVIEVCTVGESDGRSSAKRHRHHTRRLGFSLCLCAIHILPTAHHVHLGEPPCFLLWAFTLTDLGRLLLLLGNKRQGSVVV